MYKGEHKNIRIPIDDDLTDESRMLLFHYIPSIVELIGKYIRDRQGVLVHCHAGCQRSATVVAAYIMSQTGYQYTLLSSDSHLIRDPSKLRYKSSNFVPTYEDSVFLSRLSDISHSKPVNDSAELKGGFCDFHKHNPLAIERKCIHLDKDVCGSTSCCVLLGGSKCVSGNENGPFMKSNYNDSTIKNNDHYYRDGKCYGNCPGNEPPYQTY